MSRRYAILDDNQRRLEMRVSELRQRLPALLRPRACAAMVIGSVAEGQARDASDIDVLIILAAGVPSRRDYVWWDACVAPHLTGEEKGAFPVQPVIVGRAALATSEPNLRAALRRGLAIWDPEGLFGDQSDART